MAKPKILIIDDEKDIRDFLVRAVLKGIDCEADAAGDAKEALTKVNTCAYDLVLLDIKMPGLSGVDLLKEAAKACPKTKFMVISGYDSREVAQEALQAGAIDFVSKLEKPEVILLKIKKIISGSI